VRSNIHVQLGVESLLNVDVDGAVNVAHLVCQFCAMAKLACYLLPVIRPHRGAGVPKFKFCVTMSAVGKKTVRLGTAAGISRVALTMYAPSSACLSRPSMHKSLAVGGAKGAVIAVAKI